MDQYSNNRQTEILLNVLTHPADRGTLHLYNLQRLVNNFPQSGLLQALLAQDSDVESINTAVTYFNPKTLYQLINAPTGFAKVSKDQIIQQLGDFNYANLKDSDLRQVDESEELSAVETETPDTTPVNHDTQQVLEAVRHINDEEIPERQDEDASAEIAENDSFDADKYSALEREFKDKPEPFDIETIIPEEETPAEEEKILSAEPAAAVEVETANAFSDEHQQEKPTVEDIDDEVFDEIVSIEDIGLSQAARFAEESVPESTNYFVFENSISENRQIEQAVIESHTSSAETLNAPGDAGQQDLSRYHDEKMPYSFMWWLDKTRKEYSGIYQPYVSPNTPKAADKNSQDGLQQQYYENIFHLNAIEELNINAVPQTPEFDPNRKEDVIIQRFIHEEPHIKPPSNDKLDNENKAKKSAVDQDEMVTETLARIYADQMLYHKAVITYKKLILKFPEKRRYFADQIEQLEKKTN